MSEVLSLVNDRYEALVRARDALRAGELVVVPTDTVYGIAADPFAVGGTAKIFTLKNRPRSLPLPILISRPRQAWALCDSVPPGAAELAAAFWPGALTIVMPQTPDLDWDLGDNVGTIALRMPDHAETLELIERTGPLAVTSANLSGEPTPPDVEEVRARLGDAVAIYLDGGPANSAEGSTIVDLARRRPTIQRDGPIGRDVIEKAIGARLARA
ncbi:MAG TPA: L-threonylcarbamoyladenylate synthase [Actinomycetota bacterium]|nr:L-threonylcarbamoyladenylate synthase [Actinomycetota bacterium]